MKAIDFDVRFDAGDSVIDELDFGAVLRLGLTQKRVVGNLY